MEPLDVTALIQAKRNGKALSTEEIRAFIEGYTSGCIPDYQASALLMAIYFRGMERREIRDLTRSMTQSGQRLDLASISGAKVDKHSTGGVGDKISLILFPLAAAAGVVIPSIAGRGLGHTGGTIDKLEAIPGFRTELSRKDFCAQVERIGLAIMGQTAEIAPADGRLYALRDVTATVDCLPLIVSSILCKKLAEGIEALLLDVKVGRGAFMKTMPEAEALSAALIEVCNDLGVRGVALITEMDAPLGNAVGNALEVEEAIQSLQGKAPFDLFELTLALGSWMLFLARKARDLESARERMKDLWQSGAGVEKFAQWVEAQGGDPSSLLAGQGLPKAPRVTEVRSRASGFVQAIDAEAIG
ncbi:MAG: thymidine phosphorylase, partial [candidate division NC10 bacterium]|nr:thymidine phosphorylase [candidate division NC10 bacterium]